MSFLSAVTTTPMREIDIGHWLQSVGAPGARFASFCAGQPLGQTVARIGMQL
jgi:hypothetical protein